MLMKRKLLTICLVLCIGIGLLAGCGGSTGTPAQASSSSSTTNDVTPTSNDTIKIGCAYPLTGTAALTGVNIMRGYEFAFDEINKSGGILGRQVELIVADTQGDAKVGLSVAEKLITEDKIDLLLGCNNSGVSETVAQLAEKYQVPMISAISTADAITTHGYQWYFRFAPTNSSYLRSIVQYLKDMGESEDYPDTQVKTLAVVADSDLLGQETIKWAKYWAGEFGIEVVEAVSFNMGASDLTSEVLVLKNTPHDALIIDMSMADAILFTKTMAEQGYTPQLMVGKGGAFLDPAYIPAVPGISNGVCVSVEWNTDMTRGKDISARFKEMFGVDMNGHTAESFSVGWVVKTAYEAAGAVDKAAVRQALEDLDIVDQFPNGGPPIILPYDRIKFGNPNWQGVQHTHTSEFAGVAIGQIQDGVMKTVWPFETTETKVQVPAPFK